MVSTHERTNAETRTVEHRLAERHEGGAEADQDGNARPWPLQAGSAVRGHSRQVVEVEERLDCVQSRLRAGETVVVVDGLPAVDVVDLAVQLVRHPQRPV